MTAAPSDSRHAPRDHHGPCTHREVRLAARPAPGTPLTEDLFELAEVRTPSPEPGRLLVRTKVMSVAAVMRTLMDEATDVPMRPFALGDPLYGPAIGEVVAAPGTGFTPVTSSGTILAGASSPCWAPPTPSASTPACCLTRRPTCHKGPRPGWPSPGEPRCAQGTRSS